MGKLEFVLLIMLIVFGSKFLSDHMKYKHMERRSKKTDKNVETEKNRLDELEERIKVLERIVTDKNYDLKSQIDDL